MPVRYSGKGRVVFQAVRTEVSTWYPRPKKKTQYGPMWAQLPSRRWTWKLAEPSERVASKTGKKVRRGALVCLCGREIKKEGRQDYRMEMVYYRSRGQHKRKERCLEDSRLDLASSLSCELWEETGRGKGRVRRPRGQGPREESGTKRVGGQERGISRMAQLSRRELESHIDRKGNQYGSQEVCTMRYHIIIKTISKKIWIEYAMIFIWQNCLLSKTMLLKGVFRSGDVWRMCLNEDTLDLHPSWLESIEL